MAGRSPHRIGWKTAASVLAVGLILGLVAVLILGRGSDSRGTSKGTKSTRTGTGTSGALTAENVTWRDFGGLQLPTGPAGPRHVENGRASGFAHSPAGAVLAAIHISGRSSSIYGPGVFGPTIHEQVVGPDKDNLRATVEADYAQAKMAGRVGPNGELTDEIARGRLNQTTVWAYRIDTIESSVANVHYLMRTAPPGTSPMFVDFAISLRWIDSDWRMVAPLGGRLSAVAQNVGSVPAGYVALHKE